MNPTLAQMAMMQDVERARQLQAQREAEEEQRRQDEHAALILFAAPMSGSA